MPHAFAGVVEELRERGDPLELEGLDRALRAEDARARAAAVLEPQQSLVLGIDVSEQAVADLYGVRLRAAGALEAHHRVGPVAVIVGEELGRVDRAVGAPRAQLQPGERVRGDVVAVRLDLAP